MRYSLIQILLVGIYTLFSRQCLGIPTDRVSSKNNTLTVFVHGLGGGPYDLHPYQQYQIILGDTHVFNLYDSYNAISLGQHHEIGNLHKALEACTACTPTSQQPHDGIVIRGLSLGAVTTINYLGSHRPLNSHIKGAIVESPFGHVQDVLDVKIKNSYLLSIGNAICPQFNKIGLHFTYKQHNLDGIQPVKAASTIPKEIPILLIASEEDTLTTAPSTTKIYNALIASGHKKAHLLVVKHGKHAHICWDAHCGVIARNVEHAFRKKYNLGNYNDTYALAGQEAFALTQPGIAEQNAN